MAITCGYVTLGMVHYPLRFSCAGRFPPNSPTSLEISTDLIGVISVDKKRSYTPQLFIFTLPLSCLFK